MSKVAITGNASGSGTFTIAAPNSNTDRTLTLPDSAGTIATTNGITMIDEFVLPADLVGNADPITTWIRNNLILAVQLGPQMSLSSGQFTFPQTGIYRIHARAVFDENGSGSDNSVQFNIMGTTDNFATADQIIGYGNVFLSSSNARANPTVDALVNITDTTNQKVQVQLASQLSTNQIFGGNGQTRIQFMRLGDSA